tara:strand:- start:2717 stop:4072 length:1356 start_codon:yes stop_codon:yes gene_type:complete
MIRNIRNIYSSLFFIGIFLLVLFNRPFVGISIYGYRIGELLILSGLLLTPLPLIFRILKIQIIDEEYDDLLKAYYIIVALFFINVLINNSNILSSYTFKSSTYIWTVPYLFTGLVFLNFKNIDEKFRFIFLYIFMFTPIAHYLFSTGYFPNFIIAFFNEFSDKFEFTKASDIMMSLLLANILCFKFLKKTFIKMCYFFFSVGFMLPLLLLMSRGSFVSTGLFFILTVFYYREYFIKNIKNTIALLIIGALSFVLSTYNVNDVDFSFNFGSGGNAQTDLSVLENVKTISKKNDTRKAFLSLYIEDGRLMSIDNTTNWRLDIWQDVYEDMNNKNLILKGYGHNSIIPVMTDPSAPGRLGRDGLNENVHNYFVNIFARGGMIQFIAYLAFYLILLKLWRKKYGDYSILIFIIPVLFNSTLDMSMEGVQYPLAFFSFLGYLFTTQVRSKIINFDV